MTTFFSVDVEATGTDPFKHDLLTVGVVAVSEVGLIGPSFYARIAYDRDVVWDPETLAWWKQQSKAAKDEVFKPATASPGNAATSLRDWVIRYGGTGPHDNVFVANPAVFDHAWVRKLFSQGDVENPFSYRALCLRSASWGAGSVPWSETQRTHKPLIEHHALHDAQAQAFDFIDLLRGRN